LAGILLANVLGSIYWRKLQERRKNLNPECVPSNSISESTPSEATDSTDTETIRLAQEGDAAAFERIFQSYVRRVYSLCLRMVRNTCEAEDLTQEVFLQLFRKIQTFRGESTFSTWLHRVSVNVVLMRLRKKNPMEVRLENDNEKEDSSTKENGARDLGISGTIDRLNLNLAIGELPPGYKETFMLHDVEGYEHREIAEMLGCSIGNSKSQLHKARLRLRNLLQTAPSGARKPREQFHQVSKTTAGFRLSPMSAYFRLPHKSRMSRKPFKYFLERAAEWSFGTRSDPVRAIRFAVLAAEMFEFRA
jgi:RNA polymerase sigma-70 factor (ECF subfamily)